MAASATRWSAPASARGAVLFRTVIVTASAAEVLPPAVTVRLKVSASVWPEATVGAVKVGCWAVALLRVTVVPPVWVQAQVSVSPSGSLLPLPSSVAGRPPATVRSGPAFAVGAWLFVAATTVIVTVSVEVAPPGSVTASVKLREASFDRLDGAVKVGFAAVELLSVTAGVPVWVQA